MRIVGVTSLLSRRTAWIASTGSIGLTVLLDHLTGAASLSFLYMATAAFAVWCLGERKGLSLALLGVVVGALVRHLHVGYELLDGRTVGRATQIWNVFARILSISIVAIVANGLRIALELERWRASRDGLTGLLNKGAFQEQASHAIHQARSQGGAMVLAYVDLDGFKDVNDRHGHSAGDRVLRVFADAAADSVRSTDLFARIGGDEFVTLMNVRSCPAGDDAAALLHARLTRILRTTGYPVTCSMGAVVTPSAHFDLEDGCLELADRLMYEVKSSGKNALRIARGNCLDIALNSAYRPIADGSLSDALAQIDEAAAILSPLPSQAQTA